jgi:membrane fusion protein (multidrug efflux system)
MANETNEMNFRHRGLGAPQRGSALGVTSNGAAARQSTVVIAEPKPATPELDRKAPAGGGEELEETASSPRARTGAKRLLFGAAGFALVVAAVVGVGYWLHSRQFESTDDAFIEGHATQVSPKVTGYVQRIHIDDNQLVKAGDLLVEIDPRDYEAKLAQARASLSAAVARSKAAGASLALTRVTGGAGVEQASAGVEAAQSGISQARAAASAAEGRVSQTSAAVDAAEADVAQAQAQVAAAAAEAVRAGADAVRYQTLFEKDVASRQEYERAAAAASTADAQLVAARKRVSAAEAQVVAAKAARGAAVDQYKQSLSQVTGAQAQAGQAVGRLSEANSVPQQVAVRQSEVETAGAEIEQARAAVRQAELDLSYTKIYAPEDGRITKKSVEQGALLQPGQALFILVPSEMWLVANFKETQLGRMRPNQTVEIKVDAYPDKVFKGHVDSFQTGTGSRFSLLPAENATGNYVKVVQRLPVKIVLDERPDPEHPLAPGMSAEPEVKVR